MRVYLDNNIFVDIEEGNITIVELEEVAGFTFDKIFFSASHINETVEIGGKDEEEMQERISRRLQTISDVTKNHYLHENLEGIVSEYIESPSDVLKTITEVPFAQSAMKGMANFIGEDQREEVRKLLKIDSKKINNYKPEEVVEQLGQKLMQTGQDFTFLQMIEKSISFHPDGHSFGISNRIAGIFELLDMLGYWKDSANHKSNYARLWDSSHTFYASHCDLFISEDKRTRHKATVVYNIYDMKTKIISSKGV